MQAACVAVMVLCGAAGAAEPAELTEGMAKAKCGQTIPYSRMRLDDLGPIKVAYDFAGVRKIAPAPPPGVHPRMLQGPEDRAEMRRIYTETPHGKHMWRMLTAWCDILKGRITSKDQCPTHADGRMLAAYQRSGFTRLGDPYKRILAGDMEGYTPSMNDYVLGCMAMEAYRCWIEDDAAAGRKLAGAIANVARHVRGRIEPAGHVGQIGAYHMGFCYDYAYNVMTGAQRDLVRGIIAEASAHQSHYGAFLAPEATTSNWCTLDSFLPLTLLAIEGEEGFNAPYVEGWKRAYHNFITYGWYPSGAGYEGGGKNYQFNTTLIALARRGVKLIAHPHVRAYGERFLPAMTLPGRTGFVAYDDWGGTGADTVAGDHRFNITDVVGLKWLFPRSKAVDYVWRVYMGENYERLWDLRPAGYYSSALIAAMFPSGPLPGKLSEAAAGLKQSFFAPQRGLMVARSDLTTDALYLQVHTRQDLGGHTHADRGSFMLAGLGRLWAPIITMAGGSRYGNIVETRYHSNILIDNVGQGASGGWAPQPARVMALADNDDATFTSSDLKYAYDWIWTRDGRSDREAQQLQKGWRRVGETPNDFQYKRVGLPWMDQAWYDRAHWLVPGEKQRCIKRPFNTVQRAYRTAGIVRGTYPYALVVDDIQKDEKPHNYKWLMQLSGDLKITRYKFTADSPIADMLIGSPDDNRRLLVRVLECNNDEAALRYSPIGRIEQYMGNMRWGGAHQRLVVETHHTAPDFKILLMPYRSDKEMPKAQWDRRRETVTLTWPDQTDVLSFPKNEAGRTLLTIRRGEKTLLEMK